MDILVVGVGHMGRNYVRILGNLPEVRRIVCFDPSEESRSTLSQFNFRNLSVFASLKEAIAACPQAAIVASPTPTHAENAFSIIEAGIPVLIEKPITDELGAGEKVVRESLSRGVPLMVGHVERFNPAVNALKGNLSLIGRIVYASAHRFGIPAKRKVGDVFLDQAIHDIDIISYLSGEGPVSVQAQSTSILENGGERDLCSAIYEFPSFSATIEANRVTPIRTRELSLIGTRGSAKLDYISQDLVISQSETTVTKFSSFDEVLTRVGKGTEIKPYFQKEEPLKREVMHFLRVAERREQPLVSGAEGLTALSGAIAGMQAVESGRRETISQR